VALRTPRSAVSLSVSQRSVSAGLKMTGLVSDKRSAKRSAVCHFFATVEEEVPDSAFAPLIDEHDRQTKTAPFTAVAA
jgi:hypothetical protein